MSLLTLPPELLAVVIEKLDTKSIYNLYAAGVVCLQGLVTECHFFANTLATANTLKTDFFIGVSGYLRVLNLSGVRDLDRPCLLNALTNMTSLVDLDVSYTNINMSDFLEIAAARPNLKSIGINFTFVEEIKNYIMDEVLLRVREHELASYQQAFQRFESVHFVGRLHARAHGALALLVLQRAELSNLMFTTTGAAEGSLLDPTSWSIAMVNTTQFQLYFLKISRRRALIDTHIYTVMDFKKYEVIIFCVFYKYSEFCGSETQKVFATPLLAQIISEHFGVEIESLPAPLSRAGLAAKLASASWETNTDFACLFWDAERIEFDDTFRSKLLKIFREYFVFDVDAGTSRVPPEHDWCRVTADSQNRLDYGDKFQEKDEVKLKIIFNKNSKQNALPNVKDSDFLKKITRLSLSGEVPVDSAYFKSLFASCCALETLQLALGRNCSDLTFLQHLKEARSLKNFLIFYYSPKHMCSLLTYLSECKTLENIYLYSFPDTTVQCVPDLVSLLSKFSNLYNFYMQASLPTGDGQISEMNRKIRSDLGRDALRVLLSRRFKLSAYHPYLSVFDLVYRLNPTTTHGCNVLKILTK